MSDNPYTQPYPQNPPPPPPRKAKTRTWLWMLGIVGAFIVGIGVGGVTSGDLEPATTTSGTPAAPVADEEPTTVEEPEPEPELPAPGDFKIRVKVTEKQCFGSAGCNVTYQIEPEYNGITLLPDDRTISVIYEVRGGEDGPQVNTFTVTGDSAEFDSMETISTSSSSQKLKAKATEVYWE